MTWRMKSWRINSWYRSWIHIAFIVVRIPRHNAMYEPISQVFDDCLVICFKRGEHHPHWNLDPENESTLMHSTCTKWTTPTITDHLTRHWTDLNLRLFGVQCIILVDATKPYSLVAFKIESQTIVALQLFRFPTANHGVPPWWGWWLCEGCHVSLFFAKWRLETYRYPQHNAGNPTSGTAGSAPCEWYPTSWEQQTGFWQNTDKNREPVKDVPKNRFPPEKHPEVPFGRSVDGFRWEGGKSMVFQQPLPKWLDFQW